MKPEIMWALVSNGGWILVVKNYRRDVIRHAEQTFTRKKWPQLRRKYGLRAVKVRVEVVTD